MSLTHALVVDDSRSARVALKKLLEEHQLQVSLAASGEEALDFLSRQSVDVVFMDHTMPGMDGLEAVQAIKSNPDTATIPVMMYTTREGEVYVGQARALGAVGVMPKNVQPHELFEMLASLGLVKERRGRASAAEQQDSAADRAVIDLDLDRQAMGISLQNVVGRILEDQHMTLRSDILRSQRTFAKQVAKEIVLEHARAEEHIQGVESTPPRVLGNFFSAVMIIALGVLLLLTWQFKNQRDAALEQMQSVEQVQSAQRNLEVNDLQTAVELTESSLGEVRGVATQALEWAINRGNLSAWNEPAFNAQLADTTSELLGYLESMGYNGEVTLISHLGQFCLMFDEQGGYQIAPPDSSALECDYIGHPLETSSRVDERLSIPFSRLYRRYVDGDGPTLALEALSSSESVPSVPYPATAATAAEWNQIARLNNRIEFQFSPD